MPKSRDEIRTLRDGELRSAARMLTRAFDDDPLFVHMLPHSRRRALWLEWFHRSALGEATRVGRVWVAGSPEQGAITVFPPHSYPASFGTFMGALPMLPTLPTPRLIRCGLAAEWVTRRAHPSFPHVYVRVLGVDSVCKGRGFGGALLSKALDEGKAFGVPVYLETSNPVNLPFYRRYGFSICREMTEYGGPPLWTLSTET